MTKRHMFYYSPTVAPTLALALTLATASGCCLATPQVHVDDTIAGSIAAAEAFPILVTLVAEEGDALVAAQTRILAVLRSAMPAEVFATVRTYETLPIIALNATPDMVALLLTMSDVRSIQADRYINPL